MTTVLRAWWKLKQRARLGRGCNLPADLAGDTHQPLDQLGVARRQLARPVAGVVFEPGPRVPAPAVRGARGGRLGSGQWRRPTDQESLHRVEAERTHGVELGLGLDELGDHGEPHAVTDADQ